ncbi:hypothetical protein AWW66_14380 [Micromonospora rosaria]|uniref:Uncharacterized protein n=1 Tax=Micromonospora rosaria TaxID=47874 RepID=A0A136PS85_9ACTN|nr:hypothetical protein [Micromonospora rosaria]KXK61321.1 hypothetical protein AWW66_14380 [Micromonospora rosaria]
MATAGVTPEGIALVQKLVDALDTRWPSRTQFLAHVGQRNPKPPLTKQRLSKELGSPAKPRGPEWSIARLIAEECVPAEERDAFLADIAGLYCAARRVQRPPGYDGQVNRIEEPVPLGHPALEAMRRTLDEHVRETDQLRLRHEETVGQAERLRQALAETARRQALTEQQLVQAEEKAEQYWELRSQIAEKEVENAKLTEHMLAMSARHLAEQQTQEQAMRELHETVIHQQALLHDQKARQEELAAGNAALLTRNRTLVERTCRLIAGAENHVAVETLVDNRLVREVVRTPVNRQLALYLLSHLDQTGHQVAEVAGAVQMPVEQLRLIITGRELPTVEQVQRIAGEIGADPGYAHRLHTRAAWGVPAMLAAPTRPGGTAQRFDHLVASNFGDPSPLVAPESPPGHLPCPPADGDTPPRPRSGSHPAGDQSTDRVAVALYESTAARHHRAVERRAHRQRSLQQVREVHARKERWLVLLRASIGIGYSTIGLGWLLLLVTSDRWSLAGGLSPLVVLLTGIAVYVTGRWRPAGPDRYDDGDDSDSPPPRRGRPRLVRRSLRQHAPRPVRPPGLVDRAGAGPGRTSGSGWPPAPPESAADTPPSTDLDPTITLPRPRTASGLPAPEWAC